MKRVILGSLSGGVWFFVQVLSAFILTPVIVSQLGNRSYGAWEILLSTYAYIDLLGLGINPAIVRYVARFEAQNDRAQLRMIFTSSMLISLAMGIIGGSVVWGLAYHSERLLNLSPIQIDGLRTCILVMAVSVLLGFPKLIVQSALLGLQQHLYVNAMRTILWLVQSLALYFALTRGPEPGIVWLAVITLVFSIIHLLLMSILLSRLETGLAFQFRAFSWAGMREIFTFSMKSITIMAAARIQNQSIPIIIGWLMGPAEVPIFVIANRLASYANSLSLSLGIPLVPHFSEIDAKGSLEAKRSVWLSSSRALQLVIFGIGISILALGEPFLAVWIGDDYAVEGRWVVRFSSLAFLATGIAPNSGRMLIAMARHGHAASVFVVTTIVSVPATILLGSGFGISGIALSLFVFRAATSIATFVLATRQIDLPMLVHLRSTAARFVLPMILGLASYMILRVIWTPSGYMPILGHAALAGSVYVLASWKLAIDQEERAFLVAAARKLKSRLV